MNTDLKYFNEEEKKNVAAYVEALRSMLGSELEIGRASCRERV